MITRRLMFLSILFAMELGSMLTFVIHAQKNPKRLYIQNEKKKRVSIKFKYINNLIIIPVFINSSDTLNFILDTGISNTILQTSNLPGISPLKFSKDFIITGMGDGKSLLAHHSPENTIRIGGILGEHQDLLVIDHSEMKLSNVLGIPIHGLIGFDLFKDLIVEINYDLQVVHFYTHKKYKYKTNPRRQVTVPLWVESSKPYITTLLMQADSSELSIKALLDLGASYTVWINQQTLPNFKSPQKTADAYLGQGLNGVVYGKIGRVPRISIDKFDFVNVLISLPDTFSTKFPGYEQNRQGSFGAEMLSRFNLILDYRNQKLTLSPNGNFKRAFRYNMSGMEISAVIPGQSIYMVSYIQPFSPAEKAGLEEGDLIEDINGDSLSKLTISEISGMLIQRPGKKIRIHYKRNGVEKYTSFVLSDKL